MTLSNEEGLPRSSGKFSTLRKRLVEWERSATVDHRRLASWVEGLVRLENGQPFSFSGHEYLRGLYEDESARIVVRKAAQLGITTWSLQSDRRYYHTKCLGCGRWVSPDQEFPDRLGEDVDLLRDVQTEKVQVEEVTVDHNWFMNI